LLLRVPPVATRGRYPRATDASSTRAGAGARQSQTDRGWREQQVWPPPSMAGRTYEKTEQPLTSTSPSGQAESS
jgi:hypothetical protein